MLTPYTVNLMAFSLAALVGFYLPLAALYIYAGRRSDGNGPSLIRSVGGAFLGFFVLMALFGYALETLGVDANAEPTGVLDPMLWIGLGFSSGFGGGIGLFALGFLRGRNQSAAKGQGLPPGPAPA